VSATLSPQQTRAVQLLATGADRARIASELHIATVTLDAYLKNARVRLGAANTLHLVTLAIAAGIIPADTAAGTQVKP
jgi:DNA-binding CsgD family transcriptional regulator